MEINTDSYYFVIIVVSMKMHHNGIIFTYYIVCFCVYFIQNCSATCGDGKRWKKKFLSPSAKLSGNLCHLFSSLPVLASEHKREHTIPSFGNSSLTWDIVELFYNLVY